MGVVVGGKAGERPVMGQVSFWWVSREERG